MVTLFVRSVATPYNRISRQVTETKTLCLTIRACDNFVLLLFLFRLVGSVGAACEYSSLSSQPAIWGVSREQREEATGGARPVYSKVVMMMMIPKFS